MNPINILDGWIGALRYGTKRIYVQHATGIDIERLLGSYGIPMYGRAVAPDDTISFAVPAKQHKWAMTLIARYQSGQPMYRQWGVPSKRIGFVGHIVRMLEDIGGGRHRRQRVARRR